MSFFVDLYGQLYGACVALVDGVGRLPADVEHEIVFVGAFVLVVDLKVSVSPVLKFCAACPDVLVG